MELLQTIPWLSVHVTAVTLTIMFVIVADLHGLWWLLGKVDTLPSKRMVIFHRLTWTGLILTMFAGVMVFSGYPEYLLSLATFKLKLLFVLALVINAWLIGKHLHLTSESRFSDLTYKQKKALLTSGLVSTTSWIAAYTLAHFLN